jgi:hypothetical protein
MMDIGQMQKAADDMHKELLHLISNLAEGTTSDGASSVCAFHIFSNNSELCSIRYTPDSMTSVPKTGIKSRQMCETMLI